MKVKTSDGEVNVTSQGQGTLNTVLGALGTAGALGVLGMGSGIFGNRQPRDAEDKPVTRYEMGLIRESIAKDNEITLLKSKQYTDAAMVGVQEQMGKQLAWNAVQQNNIMMLQKQLNEITSFVVPLSAVSEPFVQVSKQSGQSAQTTQTTQQG